MACPKFQAELFFVSCFLYVLRSNAEEYGHKIQKCSQSVTQDIWSVPDILRSNESSNIFGTTKFIFQLELHQINCQNGIQMLTLFTSERENSRSLFSPDGRFFISGIGEEAETKVYSISNFCLNRIEDSSIEVQVCKSCTSNTECKSGDVCVRKCCPLGQVLKGDLSFHSKPSCEETAAEWEPYIYPLENSSYNEALSPRTAQDAKIKYVQGSFPECYPNVNLFTSNTNASRNFQAEIRLFENGELYLKQTDSDRWMGHSSGHFCIDGFWDSNSTTFSRHGSNQIVITCHNVEQTPAVSQNFAKLVKIVVTIYTAVYICLIISSICLLTTLVVYIILWKEQNIHGWTIIAMTLSQFLYFLSLAISLIVALYYQEGLGTPWCKGIGIFQHYFNMATYTWLTVLGFDLWTVVKSNKPSRHLGHGVKRFLFYSLYGFGVPLILLCFSLSMEFYFGKINDKLITPDYGRQQCGIGQKESYYYYAILITTVLYLVTVVFAVLTIISILKSIKDTKRVDKARSKTQKSRLIFIMKLSLLFGFPWIFEFIFSNITVPPFTVAFWARFVITIVNALQGVGLVWVFVLQKKIKKQLMEKFCKGNTNISGSVKSTGTASTGMSANSSFK